MAETAEKFDFKSETKKVLDIVIHSLYTHKEIFLRELISNASDAIDKRKFKALTDTHLGAKEYAIFLEPDKEKRTLTIRDNGVGMGKDDLSEHLGTIAKSGTEEFARALELAKDAQKAPQLIGQFGVGFYSGFMVADTVTVTTRKAGEDTGWVWRSTGEGSYTIEEAPDTEVGTAITLSLKKKEDGDADYTDEAELKGIVKRYSDFITYPVKMKGSEEPLNSMKAIWTKPAKDISKEEHAEFYKHLTHDWQDPLDSIRFSAEGASLSFDALLYIPESASMDIYMPQDRPGIHFYVKRVLITADSKDLTPEWLRFIRGVVDCPDVSLNISRENMQRDRQISAIRERITRKVLDALKSLNENEKEKYLKFWNQFGRVLKEGLHHDPAQADRLKGLVYFESSWTESGKLTNFKEYISRMPEGQKEIYYLTGDSRSALESSPHMEALKAKGYEVVFFTDPVDEVVVDRIGEIEGKKLKSALRGDLGLESAKEEREKKEKEYKSLLERLNDLLKEHVKEVRFSERLTESAVCLVAEEGGMSARLEKMLRQSQQGVPVAKRVMELNPTHPVVERMKSIFDANAEDEQLGDYAQLLFGLGALTEGSPLPDPARYAKLVAQLMSK